MTEIDLGPAADLSRLQGWKLVQANGVFVGLWGEDGRLHAFENRCPHQGGPVCRGRVFPEVVATVEADGRVVEEFDTDRPRIVCPWHGWEFELPSGRCAADDRWHLRRLKVYERDGRIYVTAPQIDEEGYSFVGS